MTKLEAICAESIGEFNDRASQLIERGYTIDSESFAVTPTPNLTGGYDFHYAAVFTKWVGEDTVERATEGVEDRPKIPTPLDVPIEETIKLIKKTGDNRSQAMVWVKELIEMVNQRESWEYMIRDNPDIAQHFLSPTATE